MSEFMKKGDSVFKKRKWDMLLFTKGEFSFYYYMYIGMAKLLREVFFLKLAELTLCYTGGTQCARTCRWSCVMSQWTLQISSYFMTLFLFTFPRTPWGIFKKKSWKFRKNRKKKFFDLSDIRKNFKKYFFFLFWIKFILFLPESEFYMFLAFFWCI